MDIGTMDITVLYKIENIITKKKIEEAQIRMTQTIAKLTTIATNPLQIEFI